MSNPFAIRTNPGVLTAADQEAGEEKDNQDSKGDEEGFEHDESARFIFSSAGRISPKRFY